MLSRLLIGLRASLMEVCILNSCLYPSTNFPSSSRSLTRYAYTKFLVAESASISTMNGSAWMPDLGVNLK